MSLGAPFRSVVPDQLLPTLPDEPLPALGEPPLLLDEPLLEELLPEELLPLDELAAPDEDPCPPAKGAQRTLQKATRSGAGCSTWRRAESNPETAMTKPPITSHRRVSNCVFISSLLDRTARDRPNDGSARLTEQRRWFSFQGKLD
ncbi:hypothetical protein [Methylocapsa sp. S129]|uniref:hypothetical protein n=1 Tax=Methylocapsa sp. S129 TaxID=1641869 RepID=UPI001AED2C24|nr:hypothetical protein [Methylocapsa sp. S129]